MAKFLRDIRIGTIFHGDVRRRMRCDTVRGGERISNRRVVDRSVSPARAVVGGEIRICPDLDSRLTGIRRVVLDLFVVQLFEFAGFGE